MTIDLTEEDWLTIKWCALQGAQDAVSGIELSDGDPAHKSSIENAMRNFEQQFFAQYYRESRKPT